MKRIEIKNASAIYNPAWDVPMRRKPAKPRTQREGTVYSVVPRRVDHKPADER